MKNRELKKYHTGAVATGATAAGAASLGALAMGAVALGAIAVGALAIGRLKVGRASLRRVEIRELSVGRLDVGSVGKPGNLTAIARIRSASGRGDELAQFLLDQTAAGNTRASFLLAHRSQDDPDLFMLQDTRPDEPAPEHPAHVARLDALLRRAAQLGLVASSADDQVDVGHFRMI